MKFIVKNKELHPETLRVLFRQVLAIAIQNDYKKVTEILDSFSIPYEIKD